MKMLNIAERCILWNSQRYDQVWNYDLAAKLLLEETEELFLATKPVDKLDAIGDITFVAMGVFWKLGFTTEQVTEIMHGIDLSKCSMMEANMYAQDVIYSAMDILDDNLKGAFPGLSLACHCLFVTALGQLRGMGLQHKFYEVVHAICDSNATKEIKGKVDPSVKANVVKGAGFVPPTEALLEIYNTLYHAQVEA